MSSRLISICSSLFSAFTLSILNLLARRNVPHLGQNLSDSYCSRDTMVPHFRHSNSTCALNPKKPHSCYSHLCMHETCSRIHCNSFEVASCHTIFTLQDFHQPPEIQAVLPVVFQHSSASPPSTRVPQVADLSGRECVFPR